MTTPTVLVNITAPAAGSIIDRSVTVTGACGLDAHGDNRVAQFGLFSVNISIGPTGGGLVTANANGTWSFTGTVPGDVADGNQLTISVVASGSYTTDPDHAEPFAADDGTDAISVQLRPPPPDLTAPQVVINTFVNDATVDQPPFRVPLLSGQATDNVGVAQVQYTIDNGPRQAMDSVTGNPASVSWSKANLDFDIGEHTVVVIASDAAGNSGTASATVTVRATPPPPPPPPPTTTVDAVFTPTFRHTNWIDNVDRIQADGSNGFNVRFDAIDSDLQQMSDVVSQIDTALTQALSGGPATTLQRLTPAVDLVPLVAPGQNGWFYDSIGIAHPAGGSGGGVAVMDLNLPEQIRLVSFRAIGLNPGPVAPFSITLFRSPLTDPTKADKLAGIDASQPLTNPYDATVPVTAAFAAVDPSTFRYYVIAEAHFVADPSATSLAAVQLVYSAG